MRWEHGPTPLVTLVTAFRLTVDCELDPGGVSAAVLQGMEGALRTLWRLLLEVDARRDIGGKLMEDFFVLLLQAPAALYAPVFGPCSCVSLKLCSLRQPCGVRYPGVHQRRLVHAL